MWHTWDKPLCMKLDKPLCICHEPICSVSRVTGQVPRAEQFTHCTAQQRATNNLLPHLLPLPPCCHSSSGQVVVSDYATGKKMKTLLSRGPRAGCLGFASSHPSLLCGGKGSGQLLVWDVLNTKDGAQEYNVHRVSMWQGRR